jgi:hypothetical protein
VVGSGPKWSLAYCLAASAPLFACAMGDGAREGSGRAEPAARARADLARAQPAAVAFVANELVGRPTDRSVVLKAVADQSAEAYVEYGKSAGSYPSSTSPATFADGLIEITLGGLDPDTRYHYRLRHRSSGSSDAFAAGAEHGFRTQRARASTFTFAVQSDSHQGFGPFYSDALYGVTLANVLADQPDFLFDLGDTVSTDDAVETETTVRQKYLAQRSSLGSLGHSVPIFLVLGNHENEEGWNLDDFGTNLAASLPVLGANARKRYFANPVPNAFYTGNSEPLAQIDGDHLRGNYYAFEWGSALFVAIDPFWYTLKKPFTGATGGEKDDEVVGNRWDWTLGKVQYDWLEQTLSNSRAPFKFVFAHHPTGGTTDYVRGGAKGAKFCEWGGYEIDGTTWGFDARRPGWGKPVHQLLVDTGVSAFFHGHDHLYAKEDLDGIVYQEVPHAANADYGSGFPSNDVDYAGAVRMNNSGHLRVTVSPTLVTVDYVRAFLAGAGQNRSVAHSYVISPCASAGSDGRACDDGNACTVTDRCSNGACAGTGAPNCDDGNACTLDRCAPGSGCTHTNDDGAACDDSDACTLTDRCSNGACTGTGAPNCDDDNPCTTDGCAPRSGCVHADNTLACDDANACTAGDRCSGGSCRGSAVSCDDGNACTDDVCDGALGCRHANNTDACDDGNACTIEDRCGAALCAGVPRVCPAADACHAPGACNPSSGVCSEPRLADGSACTGGVCQAGICVEDDGRPAGGAGESGGGGQAGEAGANDGGSGANHGGAGAASGHGGASSGGGGAPNTAGGTHSARAGEGGEGAARGEGGRAGTAGESGDAGARSDGGMNESSGGVGASSGLGGGAAAGAGTASGASGGDTPRPAPGTRSQSGCSCSLSPFERSPDPRALLFALLGAGVIQRRRSRRMRASQPSLNGR